MSSPRHPCYVCGRLVTLVAISGKVRAHGSGPGLGWLPCPGSGKPPAPITHDKDEDDEWRPDRRTE